MFEKLSAVIKFLKPVLELVGSLIVLSGILALALLLGHNEGLSVAEPALAKLRQLEVKIDHLQQSMDSEHACSAKLPSAVQNGKGQ